MKLKQIATIGLSILTVGSLKTQSIAKTSEIEASGKISPSYYETFVIPGNTVTIERSITVNIEDIKEVIETSTAPNQLDILFLADNTDSMSPAIQNVQNNARSLLNSIEQTYNNVQFGVARYYGDPQETEKAFEGTGEYIEFTKSFTYLEASKTCFSPQGEEYPCYQYRIDYTEGDETETWTNWISQERRNKYGDFYQNTGVKEAGEKIKTVIGANAAYQLQTKLSGNKEKALTEISNWSAGDGGNWREGSFFALHQAATNGSSINEFGTNSNVSWRNNAKKVIVWFGDAASHTDTVSLEQTINALKEKDISVIAIHTKSTERSKTEGLNADLQASSIANATNGAYADVYSNELSETIEKLIGKTVLETKTTAPEIDLDFISEQNGDNLEIKYYCADTLGCDNVKDGDTRQFKIEVATSKKGGHFEFKTIETNTEAEATTVIHALYPD